MGNKSNSDGDPDPASFGIITKLLWSFLILMWVQLLCLLYYVGTIVVFTLSQCFIYFASLVFISIKRPILGLSENLIEKDIYIVIFDKRKCYLKEGKHKTTTKNEKKKKKIHTQTHWKSFYAHLTPYILFIHCLIVISYFYINSSAIKLFFEV